ncbi:RadC family protein [uncultured Lactobacillus sp.]|uniref:JAB domain-containing protein n=1 Tax=uncultured Lactobacillus sp. TaxID=153152 RepID=UPI0026204530|nr:JAB domain-containing protein [uncultured Lactobacillus sp.]
MFKRKPNHYFVRTDLELLAQLFEQLENREIHTLRDLSFFLKNKKLNSFDNVVQFITSSECPAEISVTAEAVLDRLRSASPKRKLILTSSIEVGTYLADKLIGHKQEELWALYIDNSNHIIAEKKLFQGTLNRSVAHPREIFRWAVIYGCSGIFIAHNHPSGKLTPSASDLELTQNLYQAAEMMKIDFLDHFIVGQGQYLSLREKNCFKVL